MQMRTGCGWMVLVLAGLLLPAAAQAAAVWPSGGWQYWTAGGADYWDDLGDENPEATDLVGGIDDGISYSAGALHESVADDQISLRMRLDEDGTGTNNVWQFLFDTDGDPTDVDWVLEVRQNGNPGQQQVIFAEAAVGGSTFGQVVLSDTYAWTGSLSEWSRWVAVDDGSSFGGDPDFFLDAAIPRSTFQALTGLGDGDAFSVAATTSTSHNSFNKDMPLGLDPNDPVASGFADRLRSAPEPGTAGLSGMGLLWLGALRSRARSRRQRG